MTSLALFVVLATQSAPAEVSVRVDGEGYFRFLRGQQQVYSKAATLVVTNGKLCAADGPTVLPTLRVSGNPSGIAVSLDGTVTVSYGDDRKKIGRLALVQFTDDIRPVQSGDYWLCYGSPAIGNPGEGDYGLIRMEVSETITNPQRARTPKAPAPVVDSGGFEIELPEMVTIDSNQIRFEHLGIQNPRLVDLELGDTPAIGVTRVISRSAIEARLKLAGIEEYRLSGAAQVKVKRRGQTISHQDFVKTAMAGIGAAGETWTERGPESPAMEAPSGSLELAVENVRPSGITRQVTVAVYVDGKRFNSRNVLLVSGPPAATRTVTPGTIVTVRVKRGNVVIETKGKVLKSDSSGVTVAVEPSKAQLTGQLIKDGVVQVEA